MDPETVLEKLDEAIDDCDRQSVFEHTDALIGWMQGGGFNPMDKRIGTDFRANLTRYQFRAYLEHLRAATGIENA